MSPLSKLKRRPVTATWFVPMFTFRATARACFPSCSVPRLIRSHCAICRRSHVPYFRLYDLRSTYATRLSAGGIADEWVSQMLRQTDAQVFKNYSQMKLQMKREALVKLNREANESGTAKNSDTLKRA